MNRIDVHDPRLVRFQHNLFQQARDRQVICRGHGVTFAIRHYNCERHKRHDRQSPVKLSDRDGNWIELRHAANLRPRPNPVNERITLF
jgi:hypothetical protein